MIKRFVVGILGFVIFTLLFISSVYADQVILPVYQDTYVEEGYPNAIVWDNRNLFLGYDSIWGKERTRIYIQFDFSLIPPILYSDTGRLQSVQIQLYQYQRQALGSYNFYLFQLLLPFLQGEVNWYTQPIVGELIGEFSFSESLAYQSIDITNWIIGFLQGGENNGFALVAVDEYSAGSIFWSDSCEVAGECAKPRLVINYDSNMPPLAGMVTSHDVYSITGENQTLLTWDTSTDPEGDSITYSVLQSAGSDFSSELVQYSGLSENNISLNLNSGSNFVKVLYCDPYRCTETNPIEIVLDDLSPGIPIANPLPPYVSGKSIEVSWQQSIDNYSNNVSYQVCYGYTSDLEDCQTTDWTGNLSFVINDIEIDGEMYFWVRAQDDFENISDWSNRGSTVVDNNSPVLGKLTILNSVISPSNPTSTGVLDEQVFEGDVFDVTLQEWRLFVMDQFHNVVFSVEGVGTSIEYMYQPVLPDGTYFAFLEATDLIGNTARSNIVSFRIDDTSPIISKINIDNAKIRTVASEYLTFSVSEESTCLVTLNSVTVGQAGLLNYAHGGNKLLLHCIDTAGNSVKQQLTINVDLIPPEAPLIQVISASLADIRLEVTAEIGSTVSVFVSGVKLTTVFMDVNVKKFSFAKIFYPSLDYEVRGFTVDLAGNQSPWSEKRMFKIPSLRELGIGGGEFILPQKEYSPTGECTITFSQSNNSYNVDCNLSAPYIRSVSRVNSGAVSGGVLEVSGKHIPTVNVNIIYKRCKKKSFLNPETWFSCIEETYFTETLKVEDSSSNSWIYGQLTSQPVNGFITSEKPNTEEFTLKYRVEDLNAKRLYRIKQHLFLTSYTSLGDYFGSFEFSRPSTWFLIPPEVSMSGSKYFSFMFSRLINVTQWHGYTAFQAPHKGIDFGSVLEPILAPADGTVEVIAWDSYGGECNSGGKILLIKHDNGMYSAYFHLENYLKSDGTVLVVGERVSRGQVIATSGKTGAYNCQPLGYHLHFELRLDRAQSTHVDPVPYIDINWNEVITSGSGVYPGRLTGDNPHPEY
ncbi:M23 family metallopeptidase [Candidatus Dojkabacteria bacterium]|nr:M23 family metallopeptidase [Candidatus Dojkabacteria bacterium]